MKRSIQRVGKVIHGIERFAQTAQLQVQMRANEEFRQRPLYEDLFYRFYRPASNKEEGVKMSAGEIYLSIQQASGLKLPQGQVAHFGRFLKRMDLPVSVSSRGRLYWVVKREK